MGKAVQPEVPQRTGRDFGGRRGGGAARTYPVLTDSMEPTYSAGAFLVVTPIP